MHLWSIVVKVENISQKYSESLKTKNKTKFIYEHTPVLFIVIGLCQNQSH